MHDLFAFQFMLRSLLVSTFLLCADASSFGSDADSIPDPASLVSKKPTSRSGSPDPESPDFQTTLASYVISKAPVGRSTLVKGSNTDRKPDRVGNLAQLLAGLRTSENRPADETASTEQSARPEQDEVTTPAP